MSALYELHIQLITVCDVELVKGGDRPTYASSASISASISACISASISASISATISAYMLMAITNYQAWLASIILWPKRCLTITYP